MPLVSISLYIIVFSYKLTVLNRLSLMVWKCIAVTFSSSSFKWGGPSSFGIYIYIYWYFLRFSYKLMVLNGFSLTVWKCIAVNFFVKQFQMGGRTLAKVGLSAKFELISRFALASQSSFISYKKQKTNEL